MTEEEFLRVISEIPKAENNSFVSTYSSINIEDLQAAVKRLKKVPNYQELLKENQQLKEQIEQRDEVIDDTINFIKDTCIEQIPDMPKGCYRETASIGDLEELLEILNKYKGDNK